MNSIKVYVENGTKKVFAGALDWPGFIRSNRDEKSAIQALIEYGQRYKRTLQYKEIEFFPPIETASLIVVERKTGNTTTDFGAPAIILDADLEALDRSEFERQKWILQACWLAFDHVVMQATGKKLRKGPRGGGRELEIILEHVIGADQEYLARLGYKHPRRGGTDMAGRLNGIRTAMVEGLEVAVKGELPTQGPRGGSFWPIRYFIRRVAWHVLDHAWEIEDRLL